MSPRALWLPDVVMDTFRGERGFQVTVVDGWETRGSESFFPRGVLNHHTGGGGYAALLNYMAHTAKYAPLCNLATSRPDSRGIVTITIVAAGRANHAGVGHLTWTGKNGGNKYALGLEHQNDGSQPWPSQQNDAIAMLNLGLLDHLGVGLSRLDDHKGYAPGRKVDRHSIDPAAWREFVQAHGLEGAIMLKQGDTGSFVVRLQKELNIMHTGMVLGPERLSTQPRDSVGTTVDGDYGPATAKALRQAMAWDGHDVTGETCGANEWSVLAIYHAFFDNAKHKREIEAQIRDAGGGGDTSGLATKEALAALAGAYNTHSHDEGRTGGPDKKA